MRKRPTLPSQAAAKARAAVMKPTPARGKSAVAKVRPVKGYGRRK